MQTSQQTKPLELQLDCAFMQKKDFWNVLDMSRKCFHVQPIDLAQLRLYCDSTYPKTAFIATTRHPVTRGQVFVAYCLLSHTAAGVLEIDELAVDEWFRRRGVGRDLVEHVAAWWGTPIPGCMRPLLTLRAMTRERNLVAQLFLRSLRFRCVGIAKQPYEEIAEDGYRFRRVVRLSRREVSHHYGAR